MAFGVLLVAALCVICVSVAIDAWGNDWAGFFASASSAYAYGAGALIMFMLFCDHLRDLRMESIRDRIARQNITALKAHLLKLTQWEADFVLDIIENYHEDFSRLSSRQFNKLASIADDVKKRHAAP
jgi:hypothetical protein